MDALDLLEMQHRDIVGLFDRITDEPSVGQRTMLVSRLVRMIDAHTRAEERHLYVACLEAAGDRAITYEGYELNALSRQAAANLLRTRATDVRFEARIKLLRELFDRHAELEDARLFQQAKRLMTDEQLDAIGELVSRAYGALLETTVMRARAAQRPVARRRKGGSVRGQLRDRSRHTPPRAQALRS